MTSDGYGLFSEWHRLYIRGMRRAVKEQLTNAYGDDWWAYGVLPALTSDQRRNLEIAQEREPTNDLSSFLDAAHFGRIVARNHAAAFADTFTDYDVTRDRFRFLASMRNAWAHVPDEGLPLANVNEAVRVMIEIVVRLRSREALEIEHISLISV